MVTTDNVDDLFVFYRLKVGRTCFALLLATQTVYQLAYIVLRRTLSNEVYSYYFSSRQFCHMPSFFR